MRAQATQTDTSKNQNSSQIIIPPKAFQKVLDFVKTSEHKRPSPIVIFKVFMVSEGVQTTNGFTNQEDGTMSGIATSPIRTPASLKNSSLG